MAGTVVPLVSFFTGLTGGVPSNCDEITDWSGSPTKDLETFIQGAAALSKKVSNTSSTHVFTLANPIGLSDTILYVWILGGSISQFDTKDNGGIRIRVEDGAAKWGEWYVAGKDVGYEGGWQCLAVRTTTGFNSPAPYPDLGAITKVGVVFKTVIAAAKINCWWDAMRYGTGLRIKGGTNIATASRARASNVATIKTAIVHGLAIGHGVTISGVSGTGYNGNFVVASIPNTTTFTYANTGSDEAETTDTGGTVYSPATLNDIVAAEEAVANRWGVVVKSEGVLFAQGKLYFGSTTGGEATYFKDTSKLIIFKDKPFGIFYDVVIEGNSTAATRVYFGNRLGDGSPGNPFVGVSGCIFSSAGASKYKVTATNQYITALGFYGCTFLDADTISLPASYADDKQVLNCNFEACAEVLPDICIVKNCNFISADSRAARIEDPPGYSSISHNIRDASFIGCPVGIHIPVNGGPVENPVVFDLKAVKYIGNTKDVELSGASGKIIINVLEGGDTPSVLVSGGVTYDVTNPRTFAFVVMNEAMDLLMGYEWRLYANPTPGILGIEIDGEEEAEESMQEYPYTYIEDLEVVLQVMCDGYIEHLTRTTLKNENREVAVILRKEENI